jgi:hypothetical protein
MVDIADPERDAAGAVTKRAFGLGQARIAQRFERRIVESLRARDIADAYGDVIDHGGFSSETG